MKELQLVVKQQTGVIETNFEEIKANLEAEVKVYEDVVVDEGNKAARKKTIAFLRTYLTDIKAKDREVKEACLVPYNAFKLKSQELIEIINKPISMIDNQVKELEERIRKEKRMEIQQIFDEIIEPMGGLIEDISLENIYDSKWDNVATSIKSIREDISNKLATINQGMTVLKASLSDKKEEALNLYLLDFDLARAMNHINKYEQQKVEILERQQRQLEEQKKRDLEMEREIIRREEAEKLRKEEAFKQEERRKSELAIEQAREDERLKTLAEAEELKAKEHAEMVLQRQEEGAEVFLATFNVNATIEEIEQIEMYMESIGVEFERSM